MMSWLGRAYQELEHEEWRVGPKSDMKLLVQTKSKGGSTAYVVDTQQ